MTCIFSFRCQNGGTFLGWSCQQANQCQFSTPSGILNARCIAGLCCTQGTRRNSTSANNGRCPSNMIRKNNNCSRDSQCNLISNRRQRLKGKCSSSGKCCVPKLRPSTTNNNNQQCRNNEQRTNRRCSRSNPCQRNSYSITVVCRGGYCCERDTSKTPTNNRGTCAQGFPMTQYGCGSNRDCSQFVVSTNQKAVCDKRINTCCMMECPQGGVPQTTKCQANTATCSFTRNGQREQGQCFNGICCSQQTQTFDPCNGVGVWNQQKCNNGYCYDQSAQCIAGNCCMPRYY